MPTILILFDSRGGLTEQLAQAHAEIKRHNEHLEQLLEERTRHLIISRLLPGSRFVLYYNVSDDVYAMDNPEGGTLFKLGKAAELIRKSLGRGNEIIEVSVMGGKVKGAPTRGCRKARGNRR